MLKNGAWRIGSMALLVAALTFGTAGLVSAFSPAATPVALANLLGDNEDDGDQDNDEEDNEIEGQVLPVQCPPSGEVAEVCGERRGVTLPAVDREANPPSIYVHTLDGPVRVTIRNRALLDQVADCNYISVDGDRVSTFWFEGDDIEIQDFSGCRNDNED